MSSIAAANMASRSGKCLYRAALESPTAAEIRETLAPSTPCLATASSAASAISLRLSCVVRRVKQGGLSKVLSSVTEGDRNVPEFVLRCHRGATTESASQPGSPLSQRPVALPRQHRTMGGSLQQPNSHGGTAQPIRPGLSRGQRHIGEI